MKVRNFIFVMVGIIVASIGGAAVQRRRLTARYGHPAPFGLYVDLEVVAPTQEARGHRAVLNNYGMIPARVTVCDSVSDTLQRSDRLAYRIERWDPHSESWAIAVEEMPTSDWCKPFPTGIVEGHVTKKLVWPGQSRSTSPFFWSPVFHPRDIGKDDLLRFVVLPDGPGRRASFFSQAFRAE